MASLDADTIRKLIISKLGKAPLTEESYFDKADRLDVYQPHKHEISEQLQAAILRASLGHIHGFDIWSVDGQKIRGHLDVDFTTGGNPGRYAYVPNNQIWIESHHAPSDWGAVLLHEFVECYLMVNFGVDYSGAHDIANVFEWELRQLIEARNIHLTEANVIATITTIADNAVKLLDGCIEESLSGLL